MVLVNMQKLKHPERIIVKITLSPLAYRTLVHEAERIELTKSQFVDFLLRSVERKQEQEQENENGSTAGA